MLTKIPVSKFQLGEIDFLLPRGKIAPKYALSTISEQSFSRDSNIQNVKNLKTSRVAFNIDRCKLTYTRGILSFTPSFYG